MKKILLGVFSIIFLLNHLIAQDVGIAEWRSHLPYRKCIATDISGNIVYCATPYSVFYYDKTDQSVNRLTKVNGLSDVNINTIRYSDQYKVLVIAYSNANIDLVYEDGIVNISDIKRKPIFGNKTINNVTIYGNTAYFSCGFGIVALDLNKKEISDTYYIGTSGNAINVLDLSCDGNKFYAATEAGIYKANYSGVNLANYSNWIKDSQLPHPNATYNAIASFHNKVFANLSVNIYAQDTLYMYDGSNWQILDSNNTDDIHSMRVSQDHLLLSYNQNVTVYNADIVKEETIWTLNPGTPNPNCAVLDNDGNYWIADSWLGLVRYKEWSSEHITPNGPGSNDVFSMAIAGSDLYVAPGGVNTSWNNVWNTSGVFSFIGNNWYSLKDQNTAAFDTLYDIVAVAIDPSDNNHVFAGSYAKGLIEIRSGIITNIYNETNSGLELPYSFYHWMGISGLAFDKDNNLWVVNAACNSLLKVLKPDGTWLSYNMTPYLNQTRASSIIIDQNGQKWVRLTTSPGILVFSDNGTLTNYSDDVKRVLTTSVGNGNLPSNNVLSMAEDLDGKIWVGTDKGVAVFYNPQNVTQGGNFDSQVITILQDSIAQHLLEFESVTAIAVDGSNKKWFGTEKAGVFLMSDDGQKEILHFTAENSPLLSNTITSIVIDDKTGEVFFGTANGIVSYKSNATKGGEVINNVYAYPNPVREGFTGSIGIKGLVKNSSVKITDVSGILVWEAKSEGGQAVWNGKNFSGEKIKTGVYFVFCSSEDGTDKLVTKIMVIN
ncbi:MAG: two-component regulator propeller domain-containing protein [Bacteroidota bacterium]